MEHSYDVIVIGGGAAGLSGALALGRARRTVLVIDAGEPRIAPAKHVHNYLGREGTPPQDLLAVGRREVEQYGVRIWQGRVRSAARQGDGTFVVELKDRSVYARRLFVATGMTHELPRIAGVAQQWGNSVVHCPYCHGWEIRDQAVAVLGTSSLSVQQALLLRQWSDDVLLFLHTAPALGEREAEQLAARRIRVIEGEVAGWEIGGVRLASGELVARKVLVVAAPAHARADVLLPLGVATAELVVRGEVVGSYVVADPTGLTEVPGVWVAGNVVDPRTQVIGAAAAGLVAGAAINDDLVAEDTELALERHRFFGQAAWEKRYQAHDGGIWTGRPNPVLVAETAGLRPGRALDVGCGEGADALWLAGRGWKVTGTDISTIALGRAADEAASLGLSVEWRHADLLTDPPDPETFDLVSAHFMQLPPGDRVRLYRKLADAVIPGGDLLLVGHHPSDLDTVPRPDPYDMFFTAEQLSGDLDPQRWDVLVAEARPRQVHLNGHEVTLHDTVLMARKHVMAVG